MIISLFSIGTYLGLNEQHAPIFDKFLLPVCALLVLLALAIKSWQLVRLVRSKTPRSGIMKLDVLFDISSEVDVELLRRIAVGNLYAYRMSAYLNTLSTHLPMKRLNNILGKAWDIHNREDALRVLHDLARFPSELEFSIVSEAFQLEQTLQQESYVTEHAADDIERARCMESLTLLQRNFDDLKRGGVVRSRNDLKQIGVSGWDAGRLCFLARCAYDKDYIAKEECTHFMEVAYLKVHTSLTSWEDLAYSYVLGRVLWCGDIEPLAFSHILLEHHGSPWNYIEW